MTRPIIGIVYSVEKALRRLGLCGTKVVRAAVCAAVLLAVCAWQGQAMAQLSERDIEALRARAVEEGWTFRMGETAATERAPEELHALEIPDHWWVGKRFVPMAKKGTLPARFDWREEDGCTTIKNQGGCGSCWAFTTMGALENNILIRDGIEVDLSEQWLISCNLDGMGCTGGWGGYEYLMEGGKTDPCGGFGAVLELEFPFQEYDAPCNCPYTHSYFIDDWGYVKANSTTYIPEVEDLKQAILDYGPVAVAIRVEAEFYAYEGGVFNSDADNTVNHAVMLVGWDDSMGTEGCWILRNTWSTAWGDNGYMYIEYGCSRVGYGASFVEYAGDDAMTVAPLTEFTSSGEAGGPFSPDCQTYTVTNSGDSSITWSIAVPQTFVTATPEGGTLSAGGSVDVKLCINSEANSLGLARYYDVVTFKNETTGAISPRGVTLVVSEPVSIPDANLAAAIREALGKTASSPILMGELSGGDFERLDASDRGITDLTGLEYCMDLTYLDLSDNQLTDIDALQSLYALQELYLARNAITDLRALVNLTYIGALELSGNRISDIRYIGDMSRLTWLGLGENQITDISVLAALGNLTYWLDLGGNQITSISALSGLTKLANLDLSFNSISSVTALAGLTQMETLSLSGNEYISDVTALGNLTGLTSLDLGLNDISDISPLSGLVNLTYLSVTQNFKITDATPLRNLTSLTVLGLGNNLISSVSALRSLRDLRVLYADNNLLTDIAGLATLTDLEELQLWGNQIEDISVLSNLPDLSDLHLAANEIEDISALAYCGNLKDVNLSLNDITDLTPLVSNADIGQGTSIDLQGNPLTQDTLCGQVPTLETRGVELTYTGGCGVTGEGEGEGETGPPSAAFSGTPRTGNASLSVQFADSSNPGGASITSWEWSFGDGSTSQLSDPRHTYYSEGTYTVSLTVTSSLGSDTETKQGYVSVSSAPDPGEGTSAGCAGGSLLPEGSGPWPGGRGGDVLLVLAVGLVLMLLGRRQGEQGLAS